MTALLKRLCEVDPEHFRMNSFHGERIRWSRNGEETWRKGISEIQWDLAGWMISEMNVRLNAPDALNPGEVTTLLTSLANMLLHLTPERVAELYIGWKETK